ncbi:MAG: hypothetical protein OK436_07455, partial [Thaumarchaeota archaeon]|nr:hypothetical protein [Nitrososphaerota archaeon]
MMEKVNPSVVPAGTDEDPRKAALLNLIQEICEKYQFKTKGRQRTQAVLAMLAAESCERSIRFKLENSGVRDGTTFDPWYLSKSDLLTTLILSSVVGKVASKGYNVGVATEARDAIGTYDITVQRGSPSLIFRGTDLLCRLEVKGSWGIPLPEVARYLLNPSPLVLARVMPGTAVLLSPSDQEEFVKFMAALLASKAERILHGTHYTVPGPQCRNCFDTTCQFNERVTTRRGRVTMREAEFGEDIDIFFRNLPHV